jgi:hypothetical protein
MTDFGYVTPLLFSPIPTQSTTFLELILNDRPRTVINTDTINSGVVNTNNLITSNFNNGVLGTRPNLITPSTANNQASLSQLYSNSGGIIF